jgi:hypothetical protein
MAEYNGKQFQKDMGKMFGGMWNNFKKQSGIDMAITAVAIVNIGGCWNPYSLWTSIILFLLVFWKLMEKEKK